MGTRYELGGCPACACATASEVANSEDLRDELEQLWAFHTRRLRGDTPPRRLHDRIAFSQDPPIRLARCDDCGLLYRNPRERADRLVDLYAGEETPEGVMRSLFENQRASFAAQVRRITRVAGGAGTGIEVGSYVGAFLAAAADRGWRFSGVDVNAAAVRFARDQGLDAGVGTIADAHPHRRVDVVAFWNCFDQLADPRDAARAARRRLRDGGLIALRVPNGAFYLRWRRRLRGTSARFARAALAHSNMLAFPYRHGFTAAAITRLLEMEGFRIVDMRGDVLVPLADEWTHRWAAAEERLVKGLLRFTPARSAPWLEVYARAS